MEAATAFRRGLGQLPHLEVGLGQNRGNLGLAALACRARSGPWGRRAGRKVGRSREGGERFCRGGVRLVAQVMGEPDMSVVAFRSSKPALLNVYSLNELMSKKGWHLNTLQVG
jgi:hypothetical protein